MSDVNDELDGSPILEEVLGDALGKLKVFHVKLAAEGEPRGLIGPRDVGIIWERHILNSAAIVPFIREATAKRQFKTVADIGSGGGFPGIVAAACLPDLQFTLEQDQNCLLDAPAVLFIQMICDIRSLSVRKQ